MTGTTAISAELAATPGLAAAWVFGSVARGQARPDSDLDVAVLLSDRKETALDRWRDLADLAGRLEQRTGRPVDVVVLGLHDPILAHRVLCEGILLLDADRERRVDFTSDTYSRYLDWAPLYERYGLASLAANRAWAESRR